MDLKEIFKHDERRLYHELADAQHRYSVLRNRFEQFVQFFPPKEAFPKEAQFKAEPTKPLLTVTFCGKRLRFVFEMADGRGQVTCLLVKEHDEDEDSEVLGKFTFKGDGETNIVPPGAHADPIVIDSGYGAYGIVASFMLAASGRN